MPQSCDWYFAWPTTLFSVSTPAVPNFTPADETLSSPVVDGFRPGRIGFSNNRSIFPSQLTSHLRHGYQRFREIETVEKSRGFDSQQAKAKQS